MSQEIAAINLRRIVLEFLLGIWFSGLITASFADSSQTPGKVRWKFTPESFGAWSGPSVGPDGTVYVSLCERNGNGVVYALDGGSGNIRWQFRSTCFSSTPAVGDNGSVYIGGGDHLVRALDAVDGSVRWSYSAGAYAFEASPAVGAGGAVFIGCNDNKLYAFEGATGQKRWTFATGGQIHEAPAIAINGTVYTGSTDGKLYALDSLSGSKKWAFAATGSIVCSPAIGADGTVYFGSSDHKIYAVNGATGTKRWEYLTAAAVDWSPALADDMVVIGSNDGVMYSLEADTGEQCWSLPFLSPYSRAHPTFGTDGNLYFGGPGWFVALDHITKVPAWLFTTPATNNLSAVIAADGTVYFGNDDSFFYAIWSGSLGGFGQSPWPASGQNVRHSGLAPTRPRILNQPNGRLVQLGGGAILAAIAVGATPLSFQWMHDGQSVANATNVTLTLTNLQVSQLGDYTLTISNLFDSVTSDPAGLRVMMPATLAIQPDGQLNLSGTVGGTYRLELTHELGRPTWLSLTNLTLLSSPMSFSPGALTNPQGTFYRAIATQ